MSKARTFRSVFIEERDYNGHIRWRIKGSGIHTYPTHAPLTAKITRFLESVGISVRSNSAGSPGNCDSYHLEASFEDGGLYATTGNYWMSQRGAWIKGRKAVGWLARELGLSRIPELAEFSDLEPPAQGPANDGREL